MLAMCLSLVVWGVTYRPQQNVWAKYEKSAAW